MWPFRRSQPKVLPIERKPMADDDLPQFGPESVDRMLALLEGGSITSSGFLTTLITSGFAFLDFNWIEWRDGEGRRIIKDPSLLDTAELMEIRKLFTFIWRQDHFSEGFLRRALDAGVPQRALRRLAAIREAR
jgi:hypothetical protein